MKKWKPILVLGAFVAAAALAAHDESETVVAERLGVRLLLTGACGPDDEGRQAVLQNRRPHDAARVTLEKALWSHGRMSTRSVSTLELAAHEEKSLGCTAVSADVEHRYALVEVDGAAPERRHGHRPPRDFIALVDAGTCGQDGHGRRVAVVNEHPEREIKVKIEHVVKIDDRVTNRSVRSWRLAPGDQKELGCSRDGDVVHDYHLLEVS